MQVRVVGPRDPKALARGEVLVDATSRSRERWSRGLSPFHLGPVRLPDGREALRMENAWQFSKVYAEHVDEAGEPTAAYWTWADAGFSDSFAHRYPKGRGARPLYAQCAGARLDYGEARAALYIPLYRDAVAATPAYATLRKLASRSGVVLFDFDGYAGADAAGALADLSRPMGHAFVLKAMLENGEDVTADRIREEPYA